MVGGELFLMRGLNLIEDVSILVLNFIPEFIFLPFIKKVDCVDWTHGQVLMVVLGND
jgi:hypothetical protein